MNNEQQILKELENISFLMGDLNAIRNGEYDPPRGADPNGRREPMATPDDLYQLLSRVVSLLERQNELLWNIGVNSATSEKAWQDQIRDY